MNTTQTHKQCNIFNCNERHIISNAQRKHFYKKYSSNSEVDDSELLRNIEEMFSRYL